MTDTEQAAAGSFLGSAEKKKHDFEIVVNGEQALVAEEVVTFERLVGIAFPTPTVNDPTYTATYRHAKSKPHEGELAAGESVTIKKKGTEFDVYPTGKS
ncbi:multiubiquitin domain-containing protein [Leifsonia sp. 2MCAF36]|uniref:multiubiquitin domain-containing protein n=1 Tax=Leifsonia sp. 2MCAF36 TaxID=3232988 RepID=UPI003F98E88F